MAYEIGKDISTPLCKSYNAYLAAKLNLRHKKPRYSGTDWEASIEKHREMLLWIGELSRFVERCHVNGCRIDGEDVRFLDPIDCNLLLDSQGVPDSPNFYAQFNWVDEIVRNESLFNKWIYGTDDPTVEEANKVVFNAEV
jgi:hypothetical protein